jgi:hypothetical protein
MILGDRSTHSPVTHTYRLIYKVGLGVDWYILRGSTPMEYAPLIEMMWGGIGNESFPFRSSDLR